MASLDPTERAKIQLAAGDQVRISTTGQCTVQGLSGAPATTTTLTAASQDFGPYGVSAVLLVTGVSGRTDYSLNNATYELTATEKRTFDALVSDAGIATVQADAVDAIASRRPVTAVGTYVGTGALLNVTVGFVPDLMFVKDVAAATSVVWMQRDGTWHGRSMQMSTTASIDGGLSFNSDGTVTVSTGGAVNTSGNNYEWFAYRDNGVGDLLLCDHSGNDQASRVLRYATGAKLKAALFKRDNSSHAVLAVAGQAARRIDGSAATSAVINDDGTITVGQGVDLNYWSGAAGESCAFMGFADGARSIYVTRYTGTGAGKSLQTPFDAVEAVLIFPRGASGKLGCFWTSRLAAGVSLSTGPETAATVGAQAITGVAAGRVSIGTDARCNANGIEYLMIAFRSSRAAPSVASATNYRPMRSTKHMVIPGGAYLDCGTSDKLKIDGPLTLEWWGSSFFATAGAWPASATNNDNATLQAPLMWRSGGADAAAGSVSFGIMVMNPLVAARHRGFAVAVTDFFDFPQNSTIDVDANQPWQTGVPCASRTLQHLIVTHDGFGFWRMYLNGRLVKERDRNMLLASTPRPNIAGGAGHRMTFGARTRTSTPEMTSYMQILYGARVYARGLSAAEARANYNALFSDNSAAAAADFVEEWLAANATSSARVPATRDPACDAVASGSTTLEGL